MPTGSIADALLLGPMLRWVGEHEATIWVQTGHATTVTIHAGERSWSAPTFVVHGCHYALVDCDGLSPGETYPYAVALDERTVWPPTGGPDDFPPSQITTVDRSHPTRLVYGSCRSCGPHDEATTKVQGVDAMRALALQLAHNNDDITWPDLLVLLGDQIYADEPPQAFIDEVRARRDLSEPPGEEAKDYAEYDLLYRLAWTDPAVRWLLSTVPSAMIFDDHDVRDDWNTSWPWKQKMAQLPWWQERIEGALASYWVYQHLGNLSPAEVASDPIGSLIVAGRTQQPGTVDLTIELNSLAAEADRDPSSYRWSYTRELGDARLVMVDSRAARDLQPRIRNMLDPHEMEWLDGQLRGDVDHLFIGTSLPFLLPPGLHDFEALSEAVAERKWGPRAARIAEQIRQSVDLEHWAAFHSGFTEVFEMVISLARGERGRAPRAIVFLSGDVHHSYLAEVTNPQQYAAQSLIVQAVCSPMRNPMPRAVRIVMGLLGRGLVRPMRFIAAHSTRVPDPAYPWTVILGPWFENCIATLEVIGDGIQLRWWAGEHTVNPADSPPLREVAAAKLAQL